jgi:hypothetical protein
MVSLISWIDMNQNFCLMPQSYFLRVPPRNWGIETTNAKDARVQIRNKSLNSLQWFNHKIGEDRLRAFFSWRQLAQFGYPKWE